ncbi:MAG TPA: S9 family peptidase, partial [Bacteroidetes bacterium]|nr:S9 family peptidase [Bacteroidota bacterium]
MKKLFLFAILFLLTIPGVAQKKPFTIEDLYHLKTVNDPRISPDGSKITFTVTSYFLHKGKHNTEIYLMNADGSQIHQMTNNPAADYAPRWSPDGKSILFISTRKNGAQLWLLPVFGGEPKQLTHISTEISNPVWSSDGRKIMFETRVFPECGAVDSCNKKIDESMKEGPIQAHMA